MQSGAASVTGTEVRVANVEPRARRPGDERCLEAVGRLRYRRCHHGPGSPAAAPRSLFEDGDHSTRVASPG